MTLPIGEKHFSSAQPEAAARRIVTFKVGDRTFGIDVGMVREIKGWQATTPLPHAAAHVRGVLNLRGVILAVYDLRTAIGLGMTEATATHVSSWSMSRTRRPASWSIRFRTSSTCRSPPSAPLPIWSATSTG